MNKSSAFFPDYAAAGSAGGDSPRMDAEGALDPQLPDGRLKSTDYNNHHVHRMISQFGIAA